MKFNTFIFLIFFTPVTLLGQIKIINTSLTDPDKPILYRGIENNIAISGITIDSTYTLKSNHATIQKSPWKETEFWVKAGKPVTDTITLLQNNKVVLSKAFIIDKISNPIARLGNIKDTVATVPEILENTKLNVIFPECYYDYIFTILRFHTDFYVKNYNDTIETGETSGNKLSENLIYIIKQLEPGEKITFKYIKATCRDCTTRTLDSFTITIK